MSKIKIEIKNRFTDGVIFEHEKENNTLKDTLSEAIKNNVNLGGADLRFANPCDADLSGANLSRANLSNANLSMANLSRADLSNANLSMANMGGTDLTGANLSRANLSNANLSMANLGGADLSDADLRGAYMRSAYLSGANLSDANLSMANLGGADLRGANLSGANLSAARLLGTDLSHSDLFLANLDGADLSDAYLSGANLCGANFETIKKDFFDVLLKAIPEIDNLKNAIINGKIDGSTYVGECACLCGTLEKSKSEKIKRTILMSRDSSRPIERFFMGISPGDTPKNNQFAKIAMEWIEEFEGFIKPTIVIA